MSLEGYINSIGDLKQKKMKKKENELFHEYFTSV